MEELTGTLIKTKIELPGLDCGLCGFKSCNQFGEYISENSNEEGRCIYLNNKNKNKELKNNIIHEENKCTKLIDVLEREFDFILHPFPDKSGPYEFIGLFNPALVKELKIVKGDYIYGRPLNAGCPVTHCGQVRNVDNISGVIEWKVVGPMHIRENGGKDISHYSIYGFDGFIKESAKELKIGMRYNFMPLKCMLQWRHSGLLTAITKVEGGYRVRVEGICLG
ncbi:MAG: (Fe-S)-binding protein [Bacteroidota bacterium]|nr:(Fe-S)-binding protein [Bacteroidota bacterium]